MHTIYLAGPDVFRPNAMEVLTAKRLELEALGYNVTMPLDNNSTDSKEIYLYNRRLCFTADIVMANLEPFRGTEPDSGTVWEVGAAGANFATIIGYNVPKCGYAEQVTQHFYPCRVEGQYPCAIDPQGDTIENFGNRLNLMLSHSVMVADDWTQAVAILRREFY